jgi:tRNA pseudouridine55 synthase
MDGILNINKPAGLTSFAVVSRVKRITGEKHCGHAGTLDPLATGVLLVCLGQATRILEYLFEDNKTYLAEIKLGITTDSYDSSGKLTGQADASGIELKEVEQVLNQFKGCIEQQPPMYSALKHHGQPLYRLARQGIEVERKSRLIQIYRLEIIRWELPLFHLEVECSKGTYIRSLAHDIGRALGCGAIMQNLTRLRAGSFDIADSISLEQLETSFKAGQGEGLLQPADRALQHLAVIIVNPEQQSRLVNGRPVALSEKTYPDGQICRIYNQNGAFIGIARYTAEQKCWQPLKILAAGCGRQSCTDA